MKNLLQFIQEKLIINKNTEISDPDRKDPSSWGIGDILSGTFGYNMTLPVFYEIVKCTGKGFTCVRRTARLDSGHYNGSFYEVPDEKSREKDLKGKTYRGTIKKSQYGGYVKVDGHLTHLWDGKPVWGNDMD